MALYNRVDLRVDLDDGVELQFVGVYVLRWEGVWGEPTVGFARCDTKQMLDRLMAGIKGLTNATDGIEDEMRDVLRKCLEPDDAE